MNNAITEAELRVLISLAQKALWAPTEIRKIIQQHRVNIIPANFYSNVPSVDEVENSFEYRSTEEEVYNEGIFDPTIIAEFTDLLIPYGLEFDPLVKGDKENPAGFFWENPAFSRSDAMSYYCMIRHTKPEHIIEIGSGFSTFVADAALQKNGSGRLTLIEPYPKPFLKSIKSVENIIKLPMQDIAVPEIVQLVESAQMWFIDSTHTVKVGSDCLYIYLKVMPKISTDIVVHTHDVNLPYGFPKHRVLDKHLYWTEQYLLYAYMLDNPKIEVLFGSAYLAKKFPDLMEKLMGGKFHGGGGSIWYQLNGSLTSKSKNDRV